MSQIIGLVDPLPAQPEQEPAAWMWKDGTITTDPERADGTWTPLYTAPPKQDSVMSGGCAECGKKASEGLALYCVKCIYPDPPPECKTEAEKNAYSFGWWKALEVNRKEWVGLTDEEIRLMAHNDDDNDWDDLHHKYVWHKGYAEGARAIEAKLREKNETK